ncbi:hypothetical protein ACIBL3_14840 [Kribbella sp. NPDC050124]|uniref:hypothetical protein n=1 Tax=Kribbella sp. NPDC050124 TaxID=3364114 RepID=UPI00379E38FA
MEPLNLMVSLSHFAGAKKERRYLSDGPRQPRASRRDRRAERGREHARWRSVVRGVTKLATR